MKKLAEKLFEIVVQQLANTPPDACLVGQRFAFTLLPYTKVLYVLKVGDDQVITGVLEANFKNRLFRGYKIDVLSNNFTTARLDSESLEMIGLGEKKFVAPPAGKPNASDDPFSWLFRYKNGKSHYTDNVDLAFEISVENLFGSKII